MEDETASAILMNRLDEARLSLPGCVSRTVIRAEVMPHAR